MTGNVVLSQGQNVLRGKRLFLDQKAGRTELTAPPMGSAGPGRIAAHFVQNAAKAGAKPAAMAQEKTDGGGFTGMSSFRTDPNAPVDIAADQLEMIDAKKIAVFRGDVHAQQGDFKVRTAELTAHYSGSSGLGNLAGVQPEAGNVAAAERQSQTAAKLTRLKANGKVVVTSKNGQSATGDWADFDVAANTVTLGGEVVLNQARNVVRGTRLLIDLTSGESVIKSDNAAAPQAAPEKPGSGWQAHQQPTRPSAIFYPQQLKEKAATAAAAAAAGAKAKMPVSPAAGVSSWQSTTTPTAAPPRGN
jgi:lipopolysaccharide transport protein LptA